MFGTLRTLVAGASARAEEQVRDQFAIELIDQKIREATDNLKAAKLGLASLIQRERAEQRQIGDLQNRINDLMQRAAEALEAGRNDLAGQAAQAVADLENELALRQVTQKRLETRILQLRQSIETAHRRIIDLKQGAIAARAAKREAGIQKRLNRHLGGTSPLEEAEELIAGVLNQDDPFEQGEILRDIDRGLDHTKVADRLADAGFGPQSRSTAEDVLRRLKTKV